MEKTPRGTGGRVGGVIAGKERGKLSSRPLPWPHSRAEAGPGPPRSDARPGPCGLETPLPSHVNGGGPGAGGAGVIGMMRTQCLLGLRTFVAFAAKLWSFFIYLLRIPN